MRVKKRENGVRGSGNQRVVGRKKVGVKVSGRKRELE